MKFDGFSDADSSRVVVRDCSTDDTTECTDGSSWFSATGTLCSCNSGNCNSAPVVQTSSFVASAAVIVILLAVSQKIFN